MPGGLVALLDDVSIIARTAAASVDDIAAAAGRAGSKTAGVVIDDAAVTPSYVTGLSPARERSTESDHKSIITACPTATRLKFERKIVRQKLK